MNRDRVGSGVHKQDTMIVGDSEGALVKGRCGMVFRQPQPAAERSGHRDRGNNAGKKAKGISGVDQLPGGGG